MSRRQVAQKPPPDDLDLTDFPRDTPTSPVFRAHNVEYGPWFFSNTADGRFNLFDSRGTCYAADDITTAVRERLGESCVESKRVSWDDATAMRISSLRLPEAFTAAAVSDPAASSFPVTAEMTTMTDYEVTRLWARKFDRDGFDGVHYRSRFLLTSEPSSWAVFGDAGADQSRPVEQLAVLDGRTACREAGLTVTEPPPTSAAGLTVVQPPRTAVRGSKASDGPNVREDV